MLRDRTDPVLLLRPSAVRSLLIARDSTLIDDPVRRNRTTGRRPCVEDADFILLRQFDRAGKIAGRAITRDSARSGSGSARPAGLVCANPDKVGVAAMGLIEASGKLAAYYEQAGGIVRYVGKPYPEVYARCRMLLGGVPPGRILAVGDSREHDIAGGWRAGCPTVLCRARHPCRRPGNAGRPEDALRALRRDARFHRAVAGLVRAFTANA